ncbi:RNA methyltransferase [bacterium]|jgi:tRNA (guanosine-2'-O-)-methyltransferase|nr:RNA methyltransferase [bacterium]
MTDYERALSEHLQEYLTQARKQKFAAILSNRTRKITVVLVDLFQEHNASAVLRSCEAFGIQDVHVVETIYTFSTKADIAMGTDRWLTIHRHRGENGLNECFEYLKEKGYQTAATVLTDQSIPIQEVEPADHFPIALFFGTEKEGLPEEVIERTDLKIHIPMYGFVESYNVSVAAALSLQTLTSTMRNTCEDWNIPQLEQEELWLNWTRKTIQSCYALEGRFQGIWEKQTQTTQ